MTSTLVHMSETPRTMRVENNGTATRLAAAVYHDGGFTVRPNGQGVSHGYVVATHSDRDQIIGGYASADAIKAYAYANADALATEGAVFAAFYNAENGHSYLSVATVVHNRQAAQALGKKHGQVWVFDMRNGTQMHTGIVLNTFNAA